LGGTFNVGTTFNYASTTATNTLTVSSLLTPSTSVASIGTTDAITVNLAGGVTLAGITGSGSVVDVLNINSNGTSANIVSALSTLTADATINIGGAQDLTFTALPNQDFGTISGANATGKLTINGSAVLAATQGTTQFAIIGGSAGDALTGGAASTSINGGAGNDTITGGAGVDTITGGTGADSLTGAAGSDVFVFATGDSPSTGRDTISDLAEGDIIKFGTALTGLTNGATLTTSSANSIYVDNVNNRLVVGNDQINIPTSVANAAFTYSYGADTIAGTADDYITVGAAPFTATNNALGTLTLTGKAVATSTVVISDSAPTVGGSSVGNNAVRTVVASTVTNAGISVTGSSGADTITFNSTNAAVDTFKVGAASNTYSAATAATIVSGTTALTGIDKIYGLASGDKIDLATVLNTFTGAANTAAIANASGVTVALIQGTLNTTTNVWTTGAATTDKDTLFVYDVDGAGVGTVVEAVALIGIVATGTAATGVLTIA